MQYSSKQIFTHWHPVKVWPRCIFVLQIFSPPFIYSQWGPHDGQIKEHVSCFGVINLCSPLFSSDGCAWSANSNTMFGNREVIIPASCIDYKQQHCFQAALFFFFFLVSKLETRSGGPSGLGSCWTVAPFSPLVTQPWYWQMLNKLSSWNTTSD